MTPQNMVPPKYVTSQSQGKIFISGLRRRRNKIQSVLGVPSKSTERAIEIFTIGQDLDLSVLCFMIVVCCEISLKSKTWWFWSQLRTVQISGKVSFCQLHSIYFVAWRTLPRRESLDWRSWTRILMGSSRPTRYLRKNLKSLQRKTWKSSDRCEKRSCVVINHQVFTTNKIIKSLSTEI